MRSLSRVALVVLVTAFARPARAVEASALALPSPVRTESAATTPVVLLAHGPFAPSFAGVHYRPRMRRANRAPESAGVSQMHVGWFDPDGSQSPRFDLGVRGGPMIDEHLQLGLAVDWIHRSEKSASVSREVVGPGGVPITVRQDLSRTSVNMFPVMGFVQFTATDDLPVIPYFGAAGGYQVLTLSGDDFLSGLSYEGTFSGWGWQLWGGAGVPLGGRTRLNGEVYVNGASLERTSNDVLSGSTLHETVSADGVGMRFGVAWGF